MEKKDSSRSVKTPKKDSKSSITKEASSTTLSTQPTPTPPSTQPNNNNTTDDLAPFNLTPEQRKIMDEFNQTPEANSALPDDPFRMDRNKLRFVKGYGWDVEVAKDMYAKAIKWRTENTPWRTTREQVQNDMDRGVVQLLGKNKKGEPAFLLRVGKYDKDAWKMDDLARVTFYLCEEALRILEAPLMTTVFVIDMQGFQMSQYSSEMRDKLISPMALVYPEMLGKGFTIVTPFLFEGLWRLIKPFLHPITVAKISVSGKNYHKSLMEAFDPEILPDEYRNDEMRQMIADRSTTQQTLEDSGDDNAVVPETESNEEEDETADQEQPKLDPASVIMSGDVIMKNSVNSYVLKFFVLNPGRIQIFNSKTQKKKGYMEVDLSGTSIDYSESKKSLTLKKDSQDQIYEEYSQDGERLYLPTMQSARMFCKFKPADKSTTINQWLENINKQIAYANSQAVPVKSNLLKMLDEYALQKINENVQKNLEPITQEQQQIEQSLAQLEKSFQALHQKIDQIEKNNRGQLRQIVLVVIIALIFAKFLFVPRVD